MNSESWTTLNTEQLQAVGLSIPDIERNTGGGIGWLVGKFHVGTSFKAVGESFLDRIAQSGHAGQPEKFRELAYVMIGALESHARNRELYNFVMKG